MSADWGSWSDYFGGSDNSGGGDLSSGAYDYTAPTDNSGSNPTDYTGGQDTGNWYDTTPQGPVEPTNGGYDTSGNWTGTEPAPETTYTAPTSYTPNESGGYTAPTGAQYFGSPPETPTIWSDIQGQEQDLQGIGTQTGYNTGGTNPSVTIEPAPETFNQPNPTTQATQALPPGYTMNSDGTISMAPVTGNEPAPVLDMSQPWTPPADNTAAGPVTPSTDTTGTTSTDTSGSTSGTSSTGGNTTANGNTSNSGGGIMDWLKANPGTAALLGAGGVGTIAALSHLFGSSAAAGSAASGSAGGSAAGGSAAGGTGGTGVSQSGGAGGSLSKTPINNPAMPQPGQTQTPITNTSTNPTQPGANTTPNGNTAPNGNTTATDSSGLPSWLAPLLGGAAALYFGPSLLNKGASNGNISSPNYLDQFGKTPTTPGAGGNGLGGYAGFSNAGLNPGWIQAGVPNYNPSITQQNPTQNQYNWGTHPFMYQMSDLANYQQPGGPANTQVAGPVAPPQGGQPPSLGGLPPSPTGPISFGPIVNQPQ